MLTSMRKHFKKLSLTLWLVIAAFIGTMFFVWSGVSKSSKTEQGLIALVNGTKVYGTELGNMMRMLESIYKEQLGDNYEQYAKNLNFKDMALERIISDRLLLMEAQKLGVGVSDNELSDYIKQVPDFRTNGVFDIKKYKEFTEKRGWASADFENSQRVSIIKNKMVKLILDSPIIPEEDIIEKYKSDNEKVTGNYILVNSRDFETGIPDNFEEAKLKSYFDQNKETFKTEEQRKIQYIAINMSEIEAKTTIKDEDIQAYYDANTANYKQDEEVKARHILFKVDNEQSDAEAKKKAEEVLALVKKGGNFEELAKKYSQEPGADKSGGDLGWFSKGRMVKAFEEKAFSMKEGEISDLVKTEFGYHIIKVEGKKAEGIKPLAEVKNMIEQTLKREKVEKEAGDRMTQIHKEIAFDKKDFSKVAQENKLEAKTSNLFSKSGEIDGLGRSYKFTQKAFEMKLDEISSPINDYKNYIVMKLIEIKEPYYPEFKDVQELVKSSYKKHLAENIALEKIQNIAKQIKNGSDFASFKEDKNIKYEEKVEISKRAKYIKGVGQVDNIVPLTFGMQIGAITEPLKTKSGYLIFKVTAKDLFDENKYKEKRPEILKNLVESRQQQILEDYIKALKDKAKIENYIKPQEEEES
jgi:peptidyl-prolyl cis-trans isomerase D